MGRGRSAHNLRLVAAAYDVLREIQPATVRGVAYKLFALGVTRNMKKAETNRVSTQLRWAREQGVIPWAWIVDETREVERVSAWSDPVAYFEVVKRSYRRDRWEQQACRVEVWSEKGTIRGVLAPVLDAYGVPFRVLHGYGSATAIHQAADDSVVSDRPLRVFYVGDWDPSGLHMSEVDLPDRLLRYGADLSFERIGLVERDCTAALPSFDAQTKRGDSRWRWFVSRYGSRCWELDALSPVLLRERVEAAIRAQLDLDSWARAEQVEQAERESIISIIGKWPGIPGQATEYVDGDQEV